MDKVPTIVPSPPNILYVKLPHQAQTVAESTTEVLHK